MSTIHSILQLKSKLPERSESKPNGDVKTCHGVIR